MTSDPDQSPAEKQAEIERQIAELIARGYKREDLWVSSSGQVMIDQDAGALDSHNKVFHPDN